MSAPAVRRAVGAIAELIAPDLPGWLARRLRPHPQRRQLWELAAADTARRVTFRFGLSGLRWGDRGPVVLMVHGRDGRPTQFRYFLDALLDSGRQVIALDGESVGREASPAELALAIAEAAVEIDNLEAVVGHSLGATAVAIALANGLHVERAVLIGARPREAGAPARAPRVPALIVHDWDDAEAPFAEAEALAQRWPGARLLATTGLGHRRVLTDALTVQGVTDFIAGRTAGLTTAQLRALEAMH